MSDLNFPSGPLTNDIYSSGGKTWIWDGIRWKNHSLIFSLGGGTGFASYSVGDLLVGGGTALSRLSVGASNSMYLKVDSTSSVGVTWHTPISNGLQYEVMVAGTDTAKPTLKNTVKCHYHGTLITGEIFDSSVNRGEPISFPLNGVIKGWQEALQLMTVGSKWKLFIPSELAYGERSAGPVIGPGSTLIFEVELLGIQ